MSTFEHDSIVAFVKSVNLRGEKHGEEEVPAVDIGLQIATGKSGEQWDAVLESVLHPLDVDAGDFMQVLANKGRKGYAFAAAYEEHKVNFWLGNEFVTSLNMAKVNDFSYEYATDKHDDRITFRVQALIDPTAQLGLLGSLFHTRVRIEVVAMQGEMDLEEESDG